MNEKEIRKILKEETVIPDNIDKVMEDVLKGILDSPDERIGNTNNLVIKPDERRKKSSGNKKKIIRILLPVAAILGVSTGVLATNIGRLYKELEQQGVAEQEAAQMVVTEPESTAENVENITSYSITPEEVDWNQSMLTVKEAYFDGGGLSFLGEPSTEAKNYMIGCRDHATVNGKDALASLNPTMTVGKQIMEKIRVHKKISKKEAWGEAVEMLAKVGIPNPEVRMRQYPHEFSGGMRQRVMIAIAMTLNPPLVIADEPTTALDVTVQADILDMMKQMQKEYNTSILLITHDLGIVANFATNIIVMYAGKIIETGSAEDIFYHPVHPYTRALLAAVPRLDCNDAKLTTIEGTPPNMIQLPSGCPFEERCAYRKEICKEKFPEETEITQNHIVSCHLCRKGD